MTAERKNLPNFCNICVILFNSQIKMLCLAPGKGGSDAQGCWAGRMQAKHRQNAGSMPQAAVGWGHLLGWAVVGKGLCHPVAHIEPVVKHQLTYVERHQEDGGVVLLLSTLMAKNFLFSVQISQWRVRTCLLPHQCWPLILQKKLRNAWDVRDLRSGDPGSLLSSSDG